MAQELPEGTVTVLFTDVEGSTDLATRRGDEAAQEILRAQRELVRQQVERHSGHEVKSLGDGFMVAFASARRAVACAVGIQRALEEHNRRQTPEQQVRVRIGLNTGEVIQEEADLFGEAVNAAARIAAKAKGGQILVSETVRGVMGRVKGVELVDRGRFRLKGFPERWRLFEVIWQEATAATLAPRPLLERTPFVGRFEESAQIGGELEPLAARLGNLGAIVMAGRSRGARELMLTGDIARYQDFARADLELGRTAAVYGWTSHSYTLLGLVHFWKGQWEEALENLQEAVRLEPPGAFSAAESGVLLSVKAYIGDRQGVLAILNERRGHLPRPGQANTFGDWMFLLGVVEGLAVLGEGDEAAKLYPLVLEAIDTGCAVRLFGVGLFQTVAGMAAAAGQQWHKAEEHYQTALRQAHELPFVTEQAEVRRWYARMLIDRDAPEDHEKARQLLTEAVAMYRRIGMPKHIEMAEALLGEL